MPQSLAGPGWQIPATQASSTVQKTPSSQAMPSSSETISHCPVWALHWETWHAAVVMLEQSMPQGLGSPPVPEELVEPPSPPPPPEVLVDVELPSSSSSSNSALPPAQLNAVAA